jgi:hypothetical protein
MSKSVKMTELTYQMLLHLSKKARIKPELYLEALVGKYYAENK